MIKEIRKISFKKRQVIFGVVVVILSACLFAFQIFTIKKRMNEESFTVFPLQALEETITGFQERKDQIEGMYSGAKEKIENAFTINEELIEELTKEINNEENGAEKE